MSSDNRDRGAPPDLDMFESLGKRGSEQAPAATPPPPPPGAGANVSPAGRSRVPREMKQTLLGIPGPAFGSSSSTPAASPSAIPPQLDVLPPPPPRRGTLPDIESPEPAQAASTVLPDETLKMPAIGGSVNP